ncbi:MAG: FkbM family methyltransferase [Sedimentisphaerales bacterium]|nr:FkbM family methyltransferase [Sedimentisphaerales bacterium]
MSNRFGTFLKKSLLGKKDNLVSLDDPFAVMPRLLGHCEITGILDAGASNGRISKRLLRRFPGAQAFAFEPNPLYAQSLKQYAETEPRFHPCFVALSDEKGHALLNVTNSVGSTSLLTPGRRMQELLAEGVSVSHREDVELTTIDEWAGSNGDPAIQLMKFDIQGAELKALKGAVQMLQTSALLVYTEIWFNSGYEGGALYGEVDAFLNQHGFVLYDFYKPKYDAHGLLTWANAIFLHAERVQK